MRIYTVSEFREELNELLSQVTVVVQGEISEFNISQNRFVWFTISDDTTSVKCFMMAFKLHVPLEEGMEVRLIGSPTLFKKGQLVFQPRSVELVGEGSLRQAFELLKGKLTKEGLFDESRKRTLPRFPQKIGLVTSKDAAAYTDVLRILNNRWAGLEIYHANTSVQGVQAVNSIVASLHQLNENHPDLDAIILTRGGGSLEDLQAFNTEEVVRAIFASNIPIISAVGHERDITLADLVADVRASTPSNAAELIVPHKDDVLAEVQHMITQTEHQLRNALHAKERQMNVLLNTLDHHIREKSIRFDDLSNRLHFAVDKFHASITLHKEKLVVLTKMLQSLHPERILKRGYTITLTSKGKAITSATQARKQQQLTTRFADGEVQSRVQ